MSSNIIHIFADNLQQDAVEYSDASQSFAELTNNESEQDDDGFTDSRKRPKTHDQ
jgi:hypothetical protein